MGQSKAFTGLRKQDLEDVLPPAFDADLVKAFFDGGEMAVSDLLIKKTGKTPPVLDEMDLPDRVDFPDSKLVISDDGESSSNTADSFSPDGDFAYAKPTDKGNGNGKGRGKDKTKTDTNTETDTETNTETHTQTNTETDTDTDTSNDIPQDPTPTPDPGPDYTGSDYVSGLDTPDGFNIQVEFIGGWTQEYKSILYGVVETVSDIITGDVASHNGIDDFKLKAVINAIDGQGGYLGVGGTLKERPDTFLPSEGYFRFDEADVANSYSKGNFVDVVFHEILHSLGFGTIWQEQGLLKEVDGQTRFTGANAIEAYNTTFAEIAANDADSLLGVPVSPDDSHWDHGPFNVEVMTPYLYPTGNEVSDMTIAALEDMGYQTTYADEFIMV